MNNLAFDGGINVSSAIDPYWEDEMAWATPRTSRTEVNRAGKLLATVADYRDTGEFPEDYDFSEMMQAWFTIGNWRSSHAYPLNHIQNLLRTRSKATVKSAVVAQRLKRMASIIEKLQLLPHMDLTKMQDIGGCRAIVSSVNQVDEISGRFENRQLSHQLHNKKDYIRTPKPSGYRGIHLVYRFNSRMVDCYNDMRIEIQLRTNLQHAWANTVELVGNFNKQALKKSLGDEQWLRFFALMSTVLAHREAGPVVPGTSEKLSETIDEVRELNRQLDAQRMINMISIVPKSIEEKMPNARYYLLATDYDTGMVSVRGFGEKEAVAAQEAYLKKEQSVLSQPGKNVVLVSVDSMKNLRKAYPSYFSDTMTFVGQLVKILQ